MPLVLYNTLTRRKEPFTPLVEGRVGMYVCGPTVYSHSHIGHGKSYVSFDVIVRYLRYIGYKVLYVQNITDVGHLLGDTNEGEDRLVRQSRIEQKHPMQVAEEYTRSYYEDMDALNVLRPDIAPRASGHIVEQIELIKKLIERGYAYEVEGSVYFDVRKFSDYGKLSRRSLDEMLEGTRVEVRSEKRNPQDFALWKKAEPEHILRWPSPWGEGYPGWHIECSAMSMKYLGESFDIHGGGLDNQFPHHECEIAQSECATGKSFVRYWLHNNLVTVNGQKMSKSLGNFVTLKDAFRKHDPLVIRFFILQSHYRSTLDFSDEAIEGARAGLEKLRNTLHNLRLEIKRAAHQDRPTAIAVDLGSYRQRFIEAMDDDFNTPKAIAVLFELSREVNAALALETEFSASSLRAVENVFVELAGNILGVLDGRRVFALSAVGGARAETGQPAGLQNDVATESALIELLINVRNEARKQKLWSFSDTIRDGLKKLGISLEDKKEGTIWKKTL